LHSPLGVALGLHDHLAAETVIDSGARAKEVPGPAPRFAASATPSASAIATVYDSSTESPSSAASARRVSAVTAMRSSTVRMVGLMVR